MPLKSCLHRALIGFTLVLTSGVVCADQFVWRVPGANGNSVTLVGSVHLLPPQAYPLPPAYQKAYAGSEILMFETDMAALQSPTTQFRLLEQASYPPGESLSGNLAPPLLARLQNSLSSIGLPLAMLDRFRPWFVATLIELTAFAQAGFRPDLGIDVHFFERAQTDGKGVYGLENLDQHLAVLTDMPEPQSRAYLADTLDNLKMLEAAPTELFALWQQGDADGLAAYVAEHAQTNPQLYARLVTERNHAWLVDIEALLQGNANAMVVVGALHLAGAQGLPALLERAGYQPVQQ